MPPPPPPAWDAGRDGDLVKAGTVPTAPGLAPGMRGFVPAAPGAPPPGLLSAPSPTPKPGLSAREELVLGAEKRSRRKLMELKTSLSGIVNESGIGLERLFRSFDTDRDGSVDYQELKTGLSSLAGGAPKYANLFYENADGEAVECTSAALENLLASGAVVDDTLVWAEVRRSLRRCTLGLSWAPPRPCLGS